MGRGFILVVPPNFTDVGLCSSASLSAPVRVIAYHDTGLLVTVKTPVVLLVCVSAPVRLTPTPQGPTQLMTRCRLSPSPARFLPVIDIAYFPYQRLVYVVRNNVAQALWVCQLLCTQNICLIPIVLCRHCYLSTT